MDSWFEKIDKEHLKDIGKRNFIVYDSLCKANSIINNPKFKTIICSISGGSDSDIVLDIIHKVDGNKKVRYVFFDTGLEYNATKRHLEYLEKKYSIQITRMKAKIPIPLSNKRYGQPFISKQVSEFTMRLQLHNFKFEDKPYETLIKEYPKCKSALEWWCNCKGTDGHSTSSFDINRNKYLKEFMVENPPTFRIANKCCEYAKKNLSHEIAKEYDADLMITGIRKGEGGARARAYKNCFTDKEDDVSTYRPIFWYSNQDKVDYEKLFSVVHSDCYKKYGLPRTGCCGCPCSRTYKDELNSIKNEEPNLYKAAKTIFKDSYEYTEKYYKYRVLRERHDESEKRGYTQMNLEDFL